MLADCSSSNSDCSLGSKEAYHFPSGETYVLYVDTYFACMCVCMCGCVPSAEGGQKGNQVL